MNIRDILVHVDHWPSNQRRIDAAVALAKDQGARLTELILGGVTETMLEGMTVPVLMSH